MGQAKKRGSFEQRKQAAEDAESLKRLENNGQMPKKYKSKSEYRRAIRREALNLILGTLIE